MDYALHIAILVCIYVILGVSLNLLIGYTGLISVCHAGFYGMGAYIAALLMVQRNWGFFPALAAAIIGCAIAGFLLAIPLLRVHENYFILATFGLQLIILDVFTNWESLTGGTLGIAGVPRPILAGVQMNTQWKFFGFALVVACSTYLLAHNLVKAPFGRVLRAIREDEVATRSLGKNVSLFKVKIFAISAAMAGVAGCLFASYMSFIDPTSFGVQEAIFLLCVVIVGGTASLPGSVAGAFVLNVLPEALRFLHLSDTAQAQVRQMIYGLALILFMRLRPQGLIGEFDFRK